MQAIARVNRVYKNKPGGLIVDYLGIGPELKAALFHYSEGDRQQTGIDISQVADALQENLEILAALFHGFDLTQVGKGTAGTQVGLIQAAIDHVLGLREGSERYLQHMAKLREAMGLLGDHELVRSNWHLIAFYQAIAETIRKQVAVDKAVGTDAVDSVMRQILSQAVVAEGIIDVFAAAGIRQPDLSILSDEFLEDVRGMQHRNLAVELLHRLLRDENRTRAKRHLVQSRSFADLLDAAIRKYHNRTIQAVEVIEELIALAKKMRQADRRGDDLNLTDEELAFYEALEVNDSAVQVLGNDILRSIAQELLKTVQQNATIDWSMKENVRARLRVMVRRILRKYGYPPDMQDEATATVLEQAELMAREEAA